MGQECLATGGGPGGKELEFSPTLIMGKEGWQKDQKQKQLLEGGKGGRWGAYTPPKKNSGRSE